MSKLKSIIIVCLIIAVETCLVQISYGQDNPTDHKAPTTARELKKKEWLEERKVEREKKAALKAHMKHQTKAVRRRMRKDARQADKYNMQ